MLSDDDDDDEYQDDIYSAVIMTTGHCESSLGSFDELQNSAQAAVDPQTKPPDLCCESTCSAAITYNHHRHLAYYV